MCFLLNYGEKVFGECGAAIAVKEQIKFNFEIIGEILSTQIRKHNLPYFSSLAM